MDRFPRRRFAARHHSPPAGSRMHRFARWAAWLALLGVPMLPQGLAAQAAGAVRVTAVVLDPPLTAVGMRTLQFGLVRPGEIKRVGPREAAAGELRIGGLRSKRSVTITLTLPATLNPVGGGPGIPVFWDDQFAGGCEILNGACDEPTYESWNPVLTPTFTIDAQRRKPGRLRFAQDEYSVYLGGEARTPAGLAAGSYTATVAVTLVPSKN